MKVDYIVFEIGSTTTLSSAFKYVSGKLKLIAQGKAFTSVDSGDVNIGLNEAIKDMEERISEKIEANKILSTSSAAGGLKISVHGLMYEMTVKAAKEAALGAGGIVKFKTCGKLRGSDINRIKKENVNLIMICGGTDYGERETALYNSELIAKEIKDVPILYCGNVENIDDVKDIFKDHLLYTCENVYPTVDELNVEPARKIIQKAFEENITKAKGMSSVRKIINGAMMTTPGAVMEASKVLYEQLQDLVVFDVGGATTDVHSITEGAKEIKDILISPEPLAKRTVEGDLGLFRNKDNLIDLLEEYELEGYTKDYLKENIVAIPKNDEEKKLSRILAKKAVKVALDRHVGKVKRIYGEGKFIAMGKDLSKIKYIIGTGGALTRLGCGKEILEGIKYKGIDLSMIPPKSGRVLLDCDYIFASAGVISKVDKEGAKDLIFESLRIKNH